MLYVPMQKYVEEVLEAQRRDGLIFKWERPGEARLRLHSGSDISAVLENE